MGSSLRDPPIGDGKAVIAALARAEAAHGARRRFTPEFVAAAASHRLDVASTRAAAAPPAVAVLLADTGAHEVGASCGTRASAKAGLTSLAVRVWQIANLAPLSAVDASLGRTVDLE